MTEIVDALICCYVVDIDTHLLTLQVGRALGGAALWVRLKAVQKRRQRVRGATGRAAAVEQMINLGMRGKSRDKPGPLDVEKRSGEVDELRDNTVNPLHSSNVARAVKSLRRRQEVQGK